MSPTGLVAALQRQRAMAKAEGRARVRLADGTIREAELHWYEATGIGRKELKVKRYLD
jgi:hypothetical protein